MPIENISSSSSLKITVRASELWNQLISSGKYVEFIPEIDKICCHDANASEWFITLGSAPFTWIESDTPDQSSYTLRFESISGDFEIFRGSWTIIRDAGDRNQILLKIGYCLGIPVIEDLVSNVLKEKMQQFADSMIQGHSDTAIRKAVNTRTDNRITINKDVQANLDDRTLDIHIINISHGGMMFCINKGMVLNMDSSDVSIEVSTYPLKGKMIFEPFIQLYRVRFSERLNDEMLTGICDFIDQSESDVVKVFEVLTSDMYNACSVPEKIK